MRVYIERETLWAEYTKSPPTDLCELVENKLYLPAPRRQGRANWVHTSSVWYAEVDDLNSFLEELRAHEGNITVTYEIDEYPIVVLKG